MSVIIETTIGDITVDLFVERRPQACKNFLKLCKIKYYNLCLFHSVQTDFLAQTGDPTGSGDGGESIFGVLHGEKARYFEAEMIPKMKHNKPGLLSMVNCGKNMIGSQFFMTLGSDLQSLDEHCIFAEVVDGLDVLLKLNEAICDVQHRPYKDIRITHTVVLEDPFEDPDGIVVPDRSPDPSQIVLTSGRIGADENIEDAAGMTAAELEEMKQDREAKARATILEIVGDLPDADMAPPENVLFVCKLNPITTDDDLEIIFNRFGKVKRKETPGNYTCSALGRRVQIQPLSSEPVRPGANRKRSRELVASLRLLSDLLGNPFAASPVYGTQDTSQSGDHKTSSSSHTLW